MNSLRPLILGVGVGQILCDSDYPGFRLMQATTTAEAESFLEDNRVAVIVVGPAVKPSEMRALLRSRDEEHLPRSVHVVLYDTIPQSAFQELVDDDLIFYLSHVSLDATQLRSTIGAAFRSYLKEMSAIGMAGQMLDEEQRLSELCTSLTRKSDSRGMARAVSEELAKLLSATDARCLFYDDERETLCVDLSENGWQEAISVAAGLVGYVVRAGEPVRVESIAHDPRYDPVSDNPSGAMGASLIAHPLTRADGVAVGVLVAVRASDQNPFTVSDLKRIATLAERVAPFLYVLLPELQRRRSYSGREGIHRLFRKEALDFHDNTATEGRLLGKIPLWLEWSPILAVIFVIIGLTFISLVRVYRVVAGPAIVRIGGKLAIESSKSGVVGTVRIRPGDRVRQGELLAILTAPSDDRGQSSTQPAQVEVRASSGGTVLSVTMQVGQLVVPGDNLLTMRRENAKNEVLILLPGSSAPELHVGMPLMLKLDGYPESRQELTVTDVSPDLKEPNEAAALTGTEKIQLQSLNGPFALVRATLPNDTFAVANEELHYHDGMVGQAEIRLHEESLIKELMPGIKRLNDGSGVPLRDSGRTGPAVRGRQ